MAVGIQQADCTVGVVGLSEQDVAGVGAAPRDAPRVNLTGDPYFSDGRRVVLWVSGQPTAIADIEVLDWGDPPWK